MVKELKIEEAMAGDLTDEYDFEKVQIKLKCYDYWGIIRDKYACFSKTKCLTKRHKEVDFFNRI